MVPRPSLSLPRRKASPTAAIPAAKPPARSAAELALEAWVECQADDYTVDEQRVKEVLPLIASRIPWNPNGPFLPELFVQDSATGEPPLFLSLLRQRGGQVHFLRFWKAFSVTMRLAEVPGYAPGSGREGVSAELEALRDGLLRRMDKGDPSIEGKLPARIPAGALLEELHFAAASSSSPCFWKQAVSLVDAQCLVASRPLTRRQVTGLLVAWVHDAAVWELGADAWQTGRVGALDDFGGVQGRSLGTPVRLHVYDVSQNASVQRLNALLANKGSPVKLGGVFHVGVEIDGEEWSFGYVEDPAKSGVEAALTRDKQHHFRQTLELGRTHLSTNAVANVVGQLQHEYPGPSYHVLRKNCCHFAEDLTTRLGLGGLPVWIYRLASIGASADAILGVSKAFERKARIEQTATQSSGEDATSQSSAEDATAPTPSLDATAPTPSPSRLGSAFSSLRWRRRRAALPDDSTTSAPSRL